MTNREIALAAVRQCTARQYAALTAGHATAIKAAADRYMGDLASITSPDLRAIRTLRWDADKSRIDASYADAKAQAALTALRRATVALGEQGSEAQGAERPNQGSNT